MQAQQVAYNAAQREAQWMAVRGAPAPEGDPAQDALPQVLNAFIPFA